jgi:hypothetical protein
MTDERYHITTRPAAQPSEVNFYRNGSELILSFKQNGEIEFGPAYLENPDEGVREFIRLVAECAPLVTCPHCGKARA